jgi:hypothetical protein
MKRILWALLLWPSLAAAQVTVPAGTPFRLGADHDGSKNGVFVVEYRLLMNGAVVQTADATFLQNGVVAFTVPGLPDGTVATFAMAVFDTTNTQSVSAPLAVTATTVLPPSTTGRPMIEPPPEEPCSPPRARRCRGK